MTFQQMLTIFEESGLSPEGVAAYLGVSGMSLRRWRSKKPDEEVSVLYRAAAIEAVHELLSSGLLRWDSSGVQRFIKQAQSRSFLTPFHALGVGELAQQPDDESKQHQMVHLLFQIGDRSENRRRVDENMSQILALRKFGPKWRVYLMRLTKIVKSPKIESLEKSVAYGALAYVLGSYKMIPSSIPIVGHLDDFAMLSFADTHYDKVSSEGKI